MVELHEKASIERGLQRLCDEYLMTRKEAECAIGLYAMGSLDQFARCAGKSIHTVRSQIKAAPSSIAPVPRSHESRWPPISTTSSGFLLPRISPMTLCEV